MTTRSSYFDSIAPRWDGFSDLDVLRQKLLASLDHLGLDGASVIVDLGCGTGNLTRFLLAHAPDLTVLHAVDFSQGMLDVARAKVDDPRVRWHAQDAAQLSLEPGSADLVVCFSTWPHFPDPGAVLDAMRRILRPSGRLVVLHVDSRETINAIHRGVGPPVSGDVLVPASELAALMTDRGFEVESVVDSAERYVVSASRTDE